MQYDVKSPKDYFAALDHDWRKEKLEHIRSTILHYATDVQEGIQYQMLAYGDGDKTLFNLNAQRAYVSLYVGNLSKIADAEALLSEYDKGKGCIRIKKKNTLPDPNLTQFIQNAIDQWQQGADTSC